MYFYNKGYRLVTALVLLAACDIRPRSAGTAVGLGLAISSFGVTICPPIFGLAAERLGGFAVPWAALGIIMAATLCLLIPVREGRMETP